MNQHYICRPARIPHLTSSTDSTLLTANLDLTSVIVFPTEEKSLSDCAKLAEILSTRRATSERRGQSHVCSFQNCSGPEDAAGTFKALYRASSSLTECLLLALVAPVDTDFDDSTLSRSSAIKSIRLFFAAGGSSGWWQLQFADTKQKL